MEKLLRKNHVPTDEDDKLSIFIYSDENTSDRLKDITENWNQVSASDICSYLLSKLKIESAFFFTFALVEKDNDHHILKPRQTIPIQGRRNKYVFRVVIHPYYGRIWELNSTFSEYYLLQCRHDFQKERNTLDEDFVYHTFQRSARDCLIHIGATDCVLACQSNNLTPKALFSRKNVKVKHFIPKSAREATNHVKRVIDKDFVKEVTNRYELNSIKNFTFMRDERIGFCRVFADWAVYGYKLTNGSNIYFVNKLDSEVYKNDPIQGLCNKHGKEVRAFC